MAADAEKTGLLRAGLRPFRMARRLRRRPPLIAYLIGFALVVMAPAILFSVFLILEFDRQQEEVALTQVADTAEIISNAVDREIFGMITTARVLASSPSIDANDLANFHLRTAVALDGSETNAALVRPDLDVVMNTRLPYPSPPRKVTYSPAIERAFATGEAQVSGVFYGPVAGEEVFYVAVPVRRGDTVPYVLAINKSAADLDEVVAARQLPHSWTAEIRDDEKRSIVRVAPDPAGPAAPADDRALEAEVRSQLSGWTTHVTVPGSAVERPIIRSWALLAWGTALLLLFCIFLAWYLGRKIARPIEVLKIQAERIGRGEPASAVSTEIMEIGEVSKVLAQASRDRREAEQQNRFLMREMTHRAKNQYALIAAIARRAAKESSDTTQFLATLSEALSSLARSADLLAGRGWDSASVAELAASQLRAFGAGSQIRASGPEVKINPSAAQTIGLAFHELATNAAKYGALSVDEGRVEIDWTLADEFRITWREIGGPTVVEPKRSGFGTLVTQKMTARGLGGSVDMTYAPAGVVWTLRAPADTILAH